MGGGGHRFLLQRPPPSTDVATAAAAPVATTADLASIAADLGGRRDGGRPEVPMGIPEELPTGETPYQGHDGVNYTPLGNRLCGPPISSPPTQLAESGMA